MLKIVLGLLLLGCGTVSAWADILNPDDLAKRLNYGEFFVVNCNDPEMAYVCDDEIDNMGVEIGLVYGAGDYLSGGVFVKCKPGFHCAWKDDSDSGYNICYQGDGNPYCDVDKEIKNSYCNKNDEECKKCMAQGWRHNYWDSLNQKCMSANLDTTEIADDSPEGLIIRMNKMVNPKSASVWKDKDGNFNTARLVSDSVAGVVLGTAGGLITSSILKKNQIKAGMENIMCAIGGQYVAEWGDEFMVGIK